MQYLRTPFIMNSVAGALKDVPGFNLDAAWGLMRTMFATSMGGVFYRQQNATRLTFLDAPALVEFITGDQPIINLRAIEKYGVEPVTEFELYYPLSPSRALLMDFGHQHRRVERKTLSTEEVHEYNRKFIAVAGEQIYAASEDTLKSLRGS